MLIIFRDFKLRKFWKRINWCLDFDKFIIILLWMKIGIINNIFSSPSLHFISFYEDLSFSPSPSSFPLSPFSNPSYLPLPVSPSLPFPFSHGHTLNYLSLSICLCRRSPAGQGNMPKKLILNSTPQHHSHVSAILLNLFFLKLNSVTFAFWLSFSFVLCIFFFILILLSICMM